PALPDRPPAPEQGGREAEADSHLGRGGRVEPSLHGLPSRRSLAPRARHESGEGRLRRGRQRPQLPGLDARTALDGAPRTGPRLSPPVPRRRLWQRRGRGYLPAGLGGGLYDSVLHINGRDAPAYALSNPMEYFAEAT